MKILVIAPMHSEALLFKRALSAITNPKNTYKVIQCGIGKVNAAVDTALELNSADNDFDLVVDIGFAAGSGVYNQGDLVMPDRVCYHDVIVPEGVVDELLKVYELEGNDDCLCLTGDVFVSKDTAIDLVHKYGRSLIFDMEAAAIAQVCDNVDMPFLLMKVISDIPQDDHTVTSFNDFVNSYPDFSSFVNYLEML